MRRRRRSDTAVLLAVLLLAATRAYAQTDAFELLRTGKYAEAEKAFVKVGTRRPATLIGLARVQLETGRLTQAMATARRAAAAAGRDRASWATAMTLVAEAQREASDLSGAEKTLRAVQQKAAQHYRSRLFLGIVLVEQGKRAEATQLFGFFYDEFRDKQDKLNAEQQVAIGQACRYDANFKDADEVFAEAHKQDKKLLEASLFHAEISQEKYQPGHAEKHYQRVLDQNPNHAHALVGLARVKYSRGDDVGEVEALLKRARSVYPTIAGATVLQAEIMIDNEQLAEGEAQLAPLLKRQPRQLDALALLGAAAFLREDHKRVAALWKQVAAVNPLYTAFYRTISRLAVRQHRYAEAIKLDERAVAIDPKDYYALADLGTNWLRLGEDQKGLKYLDAAFKGDKYNVRTYNLLNLFDDVRKEYVFVSSKHFRVRTHKDERKLTERIVLPVLEEAYAYFVKRYKFRPKTPTIVELFRGQEQYGVRTIGTPGLHALAVCFGRVITSTSPLIGRFNWAQVMWHELNHVFTIQMSRSRVPRWLTEGLADLEPIAVRPEWKREHDSDIYRALISKRLHGLGTMNQAFTRAKSLYDMVVAYYQGSLMADYLLKQWGLPAMVEALRQYGQGRRTEQILPAITKLDLKTLDERWRASELARLSNYRRSFYVDLGAYRDLEAAKQRAQKAPNDQTAQTELAAALLASGKVLEADGQAQKVLARSARDRVALYVRAYAAQAQRKAADAEKLYEQLIAAGGDGYDARAALGQIALSRQDLPKAERHLVLAKQFDPEKAQPYFWLAQAYARAKKTDRQIAELRHFVQIEQQVLAPALQLVELLAERRDHSGVRKFGQMAYHIGPASVRLHVHLAAAHAAAAPKTDFRRAQWHLDTALLLEPKKTELADVQLGLARLHHARRNKRQAIEALRKARDADPAHPKLGEVEREISR